MDSNPMATDIRPSTASSDALRSAVALGEIKEPTPYRWRDIDALTFPEDRWLVPNVFPKEGLTTIASVSGEGKSLLAMHLAKCLSEGTPWFGHEGFRTKQTKVLYLNLEMSVSEMQRRGRKLDLDPLNEDLIILNEDDFNLNKGETNDHHYTWLLEFIADNSIKVVICDTFRAACGGLHEDKAEDVRKFFQKFQILKNAGVSVIFLEHVRKPSQMEGRIPKKEQVLGSQDKTANLEILLMVRKDENSGHHFIYQRKNRLGSEINPFAIKISDALTDDGQDRLNFEYVGEIEDDVNKKQQAKELVLQILSSNELYDRKELGELTKKQVGEKNLRAALRELTASGEIDFTKEGKKYRYFLSKTEDLPTDPFFNEQKIDSG